MTYLVPAFLLVYGLIFGYDAFLSMKEREIEERKNLPPEG